MTQAELIGLQFNIHKLMNENSVCFLWTTNSFLPNALDLVKYWGFSYKTMITWVKRNNGLGNWFRGKTEHLLVGVRGKVKPFRLQAPNLIISEKTLKHSEKPLESYNLIQKCAESMNQKINILELFARTSTIEYSRSDNVNWTHIGVEITGNDIRTDLQELLK
jgi:N6-adenosine-specific RNA methylase IME4